MINYYIPTNQQQYPTYQSQYQQQYQPAAQQYQQPVPVQQSQPQLVNSDRVWVQGEAAGKSYLVAKNSEQVLWDSEAPVIYIKTVDIFGKPNMVTIDYKIRESAKNDPVAITSNDDISEIKKEIENIKNEFRSMLDELKESKEDTKVYRSSYNKGGKS